MIASKGAVVGKIAITVFAHSAVEDTEVRNDVRDVQNDINCTIDDLMALTIIE